MLEQFSKKIRRFFRDMRHGSSEIAPDEIFLDSTNLPAFDTSQFEGRFERPIGNRPIVFLGTFFLILLAVYGSRLWFLEIHKGSVFADQSENNHTKDTIIFASRGIIYDRNGVALAWNDLNPDADYPLRRYASSTGFSHVLGYLTYPQKDKQGFYYDINYQPVGGIEEVFNSKLAGANGERILETDALGHEQASSVTISPRHGSNISLSIDSELQAELYRAISQAAHDHGFQGGAGVIMDVHTGEILALASFPEFDANIMTNGDSEAKNAQITAPNTPFLDRITSGLYTPGSIIKPFMAIAALSENIISPEKIIYTTGSLKVPNPYHPGQFTVFNDWKNLGPMDMRHAIAMSSDVYFYQVGGGFEGQKGLGIANINKYMAKFGFGTKTGFLLAGEKQGIVPSMEWKEKTFGEQWLLGNTYHSSIGQYGWQITPLQAVRAVAALANDGVLRTPTLIKGDTTGTAHAEVIDLNRDYFEIAHEGMRMSVTEGVASALNVPYVRIAAKTGTAELGITKALVNSWVTGYFPYEKPRYAFAIVMEKGSRYNLVGATFVMRTVVDWMSINTPEYLR